MASHATFLLQRLRRSLGWSPALTALGCLGMALAAVCAAAAVVRGAVVPPEGHLLETASFDGAVGFFVLTLVVLASGVPWSARGKRRWVAALTVFGIYSFAIETTQAVRGLDPRFSTVAGPIDQALGGLFLVMAIGVMICFLVVAEKYVRAPSGPVTVAVRYGAAAALVAFGIGIWMSVVTQGRYVPEAGNLLFLHAAGFHGLQAVPLLALLLHWSGAPPAATRRRVHAAGIAWLGACVAIAWQSLTGRAIVDPTAAAMLAVALLAAWAALASAALAAWMRATPVSTP